MYLVMFHVHLKLKYLFEIFFLYKYIRIFTYLIIEQENNIILS